jgi:hypothetical protein
MLHSSKKTSSRPIIVAYRISDEEAAPDLLRYLGRIRKDEVKRKLEA